MALWNSPWVWSAVTQLIHWRFPQVQPLTSEALERWLAHSDLVQPVLLDVRTPAEYTVSHLSGAVWVDPQLRDLYQLDVPNLQTPIVTYCSIGYRSAALAKQLTEAGYTQVSNLDGAIFQWANQGRLVYRAGQPVQQVHPFNTLWGCLLNPKLRADDAGT